MLTYVNIFQRKEANGKIEALKYLPIYFNFLLVRDEVQFKITSFPQKNSIYQYPWLGTYLDWKKSGSRFRYTNTWLTNAKIQVMTLICCFKINCE